MAVLTLNIMCEDKTLRGIDEFAEIEGRSREELVIEAIEIYLHRARGDKIFADGNVLVESGEFTDTRDGRQYRTVKIGEQVWMAENLNFKIDGSWCYGNDEANGKIYGRLYTWEAAKSACPAGWHLPSSSEWDALALAVGGHLYVGGQRFDGRLRWSNFLQQYAECILGGVLAKAKEPQYAQKYSRREAGRYPEDV